MMALGPGRPSRPSPVTQIRFKFLSAAIMTLSLSDSLIPSAPAADSDADSESDSVPRPGLESDQPGRRAPA
jgi:hypothetical protein